MYTKVEDKMDILFIDDISHLQQSLNFALIKEFVY